MDQTFPQSTPPSSAQSVFLPVVHGAPSALAQLRAATRAQHQAIEADLRISARLRTIAGLKSLLERWYGFLCPFEAMLLSSAQLRAVAGARAKTSRLRADLSSLGRTDFENLPLCSSISGFTTLPEMVGAMYVTEGASLGGSVIARNLERDLGLRNSEGYSFFAGYGLRTGEMWRQFAQFAEGAIGENVAPAIAAARETFTSIHGWLNG